MPYPARLNPHLEEAREHTTRWAREMGMLEGSGIWEQEDLDSHDYALLCAYTHPDCDGRAPSTWSPTGTCGSSSSTTTSSRSSSAPRTAAGGKAYLDRLPLFMPLDPAAADARADEPGRGGPGRPVGAHGARRCPRTGGAGSPRPPSTCSTSRCGSSPTSTRAGSPTRSSTSRCAARSAARPWSAGLVEYATGAEVPAAIAAVAAAAGAAGHVLRRRAPAQRPVLLPARGRGRGRAQQRRAGPGDVPRLHDPGGRRRRQRPAHLPAAAVREHRRSPSCPPLLRGARASTRTSAPPSLAYVKGLQDWQSGGHEWHMRSSRYMNEGAGRREPPLLGGPTGLGTSAADVGALLAAGRAAARLRSLHATCRSSRSARPLLPDFYMPFTARAQPAPGRRARARLRRRGRAGWACSTAAGARSHLGRGQARRATTSPLCAAGIAPGRHPGRARPRARLAGLGHLRRRLLPAASSAARRDLAGAQGSPTTGCRPSCRWTAAPTPSPANALERGLADLWARTAGPMTPRRAAHVPRGRRRHDRELAVGAGQPDPEPHPRPGRLHRDAPRAPSARTSP